MAIKNDYNKASQPDAEDSNFKLFKAVHGRVTAMLSRLQMPGFIEGFSSESKGGTGKKARHVAFEIRAAKYSERRASDPKLKDADFSIYISAKKTGPVDVNFYPVGYKSRDLLKGIMRDRADDTKGPFMITDTTSEEFHNLINILEGVIGRAGAKLDKTRPKKTMAPQPEI